MRAARRAGNSGVRVAQARAANRVPRIRVSAPAKDLARISHSLFTSFRATLMLSVVHTRHDVP